jgi:hypothetical protein
MATRATEAEVKEIIDTELTADEVAPFLKAANIFITEVLSGEGYGDDLMKSIEMWLAAHFVAVRDPRASKEKLGDADVTYDGKTALGLDGTRYGQQAMLLDYHGKLAAISSAKGQAEMRVIG